MILSTLAAAMEHKGLTYRCADLQKHDQLISKLPAFFSFFFFFSTTSAIRQTYDLKHLTFLRIFKGVVDTKLKMIIYVIKWIQTGLTLSFTDHIYFFIYFVERTNRFHLNKIQKCFGATSTFIGRTKKTHTNI